MTSPDPNGRACIECAFARLAADSRDDRCGLWPRSTPFNARAFSGMCGEAGKFWMPSSGPGTAPPPPLRIA